MCFKGQQETLQANPSPDTKTTYKKGDGMTYMSALLNKLNAGLESLFLVSLVNPLKYDSKYRIIRECQEYKSKTVFIYKIQYRWGIFWRWATYTETYEFVRGEPYTDTFIKSFSSYESAVEYIKSCIPDNVCNITTTVTDYFDEFGYKTFGISI